MRDRDQRPILPDRGQTFPDNRRNVSLLAMLNQGFALGPGLIAQSVYEDRSKLASKSDQEPIFPTMPMLWCKLQGWSSIVFATKEPLIPSLSDLTMSEGSTAKWPLVTHPADESLQAVSFWRIGCAADGGQHSREEAG